MAGFVGDVELKKVWDLSDAGVPLGTDVFVSDFVEKTVQDTVNRLVEFEDT